MNTDRPLDQVSSIKTKLAVLVGASVLVTALLALIGDRSGISVWITLPVTLGAALAMTYWLARGMTAPLRDMTHAATAMAAGDYSRTVSTSSKDEVGALATAFTTMARDLAATDQQRRELIATVSHELRTPLAAQRAVLENLVDGVTPPSEATLTAALSQTERLGSLVDDLLDLSRLESGLTRLDLSEVDVRDVLERAVREAGLGRGDVTYEVTATSGMRVRADRSRLTQVLANLLDNASRHSPSGGVVHVSAALDPDAGGSLWRLDVRDEGPGIDPAIADRIFERFSTGGEHAGGTGLGLAIARWIAALHGGSIAVVDPDPSSKDAGAHVRVTLPTEPAHRALPPTLPTPALEPVRPTSSQPPALPPTASPANVSNPPSVSNPTSLQPVSWGSTAAPVAVAPPAPWQGTTPPPPSIGGSLFTGLWPERESGPQPLYLLGSLGVGAVAGLLAFDRRFGVIAFVVLLLGGLLVWRASAYRQSRFTLVCAGLALLLGTATFWRAAEWLSVVAVFMCGVMAATAFTRATKVSGIVASVASWPLSGLRGLPLLGRTLSATSKQRMLWPVLRTVALSLVAVVLFGGLFASADAIFGTWASAIVPNLQWDTIIARSFVAFLAAGVTLAGCYLALNPPKVDEIVAGATRRVSTWEWAVPVALVIALFAGFLLAQANATLRGHEYVRATTGTSYADYVHQGFGQLTVATVLMLAVVAITLRKARTETARDRLWLRLMLGTLSVLTLAVVASALWRMHLYQQAYGFTTTRLFVDFFEFWLGVIVVGVLVSLVPLSTRWLGRAAVLSAAVLMLMFTALNPDAWVAQHNIDRFASSGQIDALYLASLSEDAVPTIAASSLPEELKSCILHVDHYGELVTAASPGESDDWLAFNVGRQRAIEARASVPPVASPSICDTYYSGDVRFSERTR